MPVVDVPLDEEVSWVVSIHIHTLVLPYRLVSYVPSSVRCTSMSPDAEESWDVHPRRCADVFYSHLASGIYPLMKKCPGVYP